MIRHLHDRLSWCLCLLALLMATSSRAVEVAGLYEAVVPVSGQSAPERQRAAADGLAQVLVKVSGHRKVLADPLVKSAIEKPEALLLSYMYEAPVLSRMPGQTQDLSMSALRLRLRYEQRGIQALLERAGAPMWAPDRPAVFLWIAGQGTTGRLLHGPESAQGATLIDAAGQRGLPVIVTVSPEADPGDLSQGIPASVLDTARSSGARFVLGGYTVRTAAGRWQATGTLMETTAPSQPDRFEAGGSDEYEALRELLATAADRLASRFAAPPASANLQETRLRVAGIADFQAHAQLQRALGALPLVREVRTVRVSAGLAEFRLVVAGDSAGIRRMLENVSLLSRVVTAEPEGGLPVFDARIVDPR